MHQQQEQELFATIERWRIEPPKTGEVSEGTCIGYLQDIEQRRKSAPDIRLDLAEAVVLTQLSSIRLGKSGGHRLALEWLERAMFLDPAYRPARELMLRVKTSQLAADQSFAGTFPTIRETDNVVARRRNVEVLINLANQEKSTLLEWQSLASDIHELAMELSDPEYEELAKSLLQLYQEREQLLQRLEQQVDAYASSLSGVFFSSELLGQLQETIRSLVGQQVKLQSLWHSSSMTEKQQPQLRHEPSALDELEHLIGLGEIKERVRQLAQFLQYRQKREDKGWHMQDELPLHLVLMGNPGTGKTTLARLIARLYKELGLLTQGQLIEVDRSHLVGAYVGQTEQRVMDAVKRADGGVLFIDEAYSLKRADSSGSDYGQAAIDTLVAAMTGGEYAGRFVVMLAGYPEEMRQFLYTNPGLYSRFPETGHFLLPDYETEDLVKIAQQVADRNDFTLTDEARIQLRQRIEKSRVDDSFGNARTVTNMILDAIFAKGRSTAGNDLQWDDYTILYPEDISSEGTKTFGQAARDRLRHLIGLDQVKEELKKVAAFVSVQKERSLRGLKMSPIELHAVFTGNPGTGKTTVAALYAEILHEIGYLKRGHLVTASRADLVAEYVGQTAVLTRRKVRQALGGVLFIDEAYSLLGGGQDFGKEAIHTLVEEMTRHAENLVVVLAGYPDEMTRLIMSNPGLASRFKKYIHFPDYTVEQLVAIVEQGITNAGYVMSAETTKELTVKLQEIFTRHGIEGNGRFSYNLVQEAMQYQAIRLMDTPHDQWNQQLLMELVWSDFEPILDRI